MAEARAALAALVALAGCSFTPAYERPALPVPAGAGDAAAADAAGGRPADEIGWRDLFGDPRLHALIALALDSNRDLRIAALNVEVLRAQYQIERAPLLPAVSGVATGQIAGTEGGVASGFSAAGFTQYRVGLSVSWELDLFGRVRSLRDAALATYLASAEAQRAAHLALVGEVASQYLRERALDEQRRLADGTVELVQQTVEVTRRLFEAGQRSELDVKTAEGQLHGARAEVSRLARLHGQAVNALALLVGRALPADLPAGLPLASQAIIADLPAGVPSHVLLRRPDILAAEHALRAANANIGAARAAFFPQLALTAFGGTASTSLGGLFDGLAWNFAPGLTAPLFNAGRIRANLDVARARERIEVARYERAIQVAFREVADALVARGALDEQLAAQVARADAEQARFVLSETRYQNGIESFLSVLTAQRDLYTTQQQLIELRLARLLNLTDLYAALGGGWRARSGSR